MATIERVFEGGIRDGEKIVVKEPSAETLLLPEIRYWSKSPSGRTCVSIYDLAHVNVGEAVTTMTYRLRISRRSGGG